MSQAVVVDKRGRVIIPIEARRRLGIEPGDTLYYKWAEDGTLSYIKGSNPFDVLARLALADLEAGRTKDLQQIASDLGVSLDDE